MRWPRGRYNGQRLVGFDLRVRVNLRQWRLWGPSRFAWTVAVGPVRLWLSPNYED